MVEVFLDWESCESFALRPILIGGSVIAVSLKELLNIMLEIVLHALGFLGTPHLVVLLEGGGPWWGRVAEVAG